MTRTRWGSRRIVARRRIGSAAGEANQLPAALSGGDVTGPTPNCLSHVVTCLRESATGAAAMKIVRSEERRVGKECRGGGAGEHWNKRNTKAVVAVVDGTAVE